jgi:formate-dependent nitrite reductase membrane component NrfD
MMVNTTPGNYGLSFKYWSPISLGTWALLIYSGLSFLSFLEALGLLGVLSGAFGRLLNVIGSVLALFIASYTGVVLSVSNQPVWSDTWTLGALFLASALSGSAALLAWFAHSRPDAATTQRRLLRADGIFALLELLVIVLFFGTLAAAGTLKLELAGPWIIIWILVFASLVPPLMGLGHGRATSTFSARGGTLAASTAFIVLAGVFLMRLAIIFSAQS